MLSNTGLIKRGLLTVLVFIALVVGVGPAAAFASGFETTGASASAFAGTGLGNDDTVGTPSDTSAPSGGYAVPGTGGSSNYTTGAIVADSGSQGGGRGYCSGGSGKVDDSVSLLPVERWKGAMSFHSRLGWKDIGDSVMRQGVMSLGMATGNFMWTISTGMVQYAAGFCPLEKAGGSADKAFYTLASAVKESQLLIALVFFTFVVYLFRIAKASTDGATMLQLLGGQGQGFSIAAGIFKKGMILALFVIMLNGASNTTGAGFDGDIGEGAFKPGVGSPGWVIQTTDRVTTDLTSTIVSKFPFTPKGGIDGEDDNRYSCDSYVKAMRQGYKDNFYISGRQYKNASALPLTINAFWESTGLQAWRRAQFGANNEYDTWSYCRVLENNAGTPVGTDGDDASDGTIVGVMKQAGVTTIDPAAMAWGNLSENDYNDRVYVAWAACRHGDTANSTTGWDIPKSAQGLWPGNNAAESMSEECNDVFKSGGDNNNANAFDWESGGGKIDEDGNDGDGGEQYNLTDGQTEYLKNLHGVVFGEGIVVVGMYILSSLLMMIVFGFFALAVIFAKIMSLVMIVGVLFALLSALTPNSDMSKVTKYLKQYFGISVFAFGSMLLLGIITLFTQILVNLGDSTLPGGQGGVMAIMWTGFSPAIAAFGVHYMFKKMGLPSPISPTVASSMGKAAANGTLGAAAGGAVGSFAGTGLGNRLGRAGRQKAGQSIASTFQRGAGKSGDGTKGGNGSNKMTLGGPKPDANDPNAPKGPGGPGSSGGSGGSGGGPRGGNGTGGTNPAGGGVSEATKAEQAEREARRAAMTPRERAAEQREFDKAEKARIKDFAQTEEGRAGAAKVEAEKPKVQTIADRAGAARDRMGVAAEQFREKSLAGKAGMVGRGIWDNKGTIAKGAAIATVAATGGGAALAVGGAMAARKAYKSGTQEGGWINGRVRSGVDSWRGARETNKNGYSAAEATAYYADQFEQEQARIQAEAAAEQQRRMQERVQEDLDFREQRDAAAAARRADRAESAGVPSAGSSASFQ